MWKSWEKCYVKKTNWVLSRWGLQNALFNPEFFYRYHPETSHFCFLVLLTINLLTSRKIWQAQNVLVWHWKLSRIGPAYYLDGRFHRNSRSMDDLRSWNTSEKAVLTISLLLPRNSYRIFVSIKSPEIKAQLEEDITFYCN